MPNVYIATPYNLVEEVDYNFCRNASVTQAYLDEIDRQRRFGRSGISVIGKLQAEERFALINGLTDNWDGEGSFGVLPNVLSHARRIYSFFEQLGIAPTEIYPTPNGTIILEWFVDDANLNFEIGKSKYSYYLSSPGEATEYGVENVTDFPHRLADDILIRTYGYGYSVRASKTSVSVF